MKTALIVIDIQMDYFTGGKFPLSDTEQTLANILAAMARARRAGVPIILVRHLTDTAKGPALFFADGSPGAAIHPAVLEAAGSAPVVTKRFADSFYGTDLTEVIKKTGADKILVCGMMTQNCVTHTAISKAADNYSVTVLSDCCATVSQPLHKMALSALGIRVNVASAEDALPL